jgi:hypothetical protein
METAMVAGVSPGTGTAWLRLASFSRLIFIVEWRKFPTPNECAAAHGKEG